MNLTPNQKEFISKNWKHIDSSKLAKQFSLDKKIVENYIDELKSRKTPKWFYIILLFIPVLFFVLLETGLRFSEYGDDFSVFKPLSKEFPGLLVFNPNYPNKFFDNIEVVPSVIPDPFSEIKKNNAFRVFVLGGSTTAGFPFSYNASFARHVKRRLEILYPNNEIEIINMGISAVNSYTVKDIVPSIIERNPDLVLIYAGHNEYYGALGVGSTQSIGNSTMLVNLVLSMKELKTYQLLSNIVKSAKGSLVKQSEEGNKTLMSQMVGEKLIEYHSEIYNEGLNQFYENMDEVLTLLSDAKISTVIGTLTSNLKQKPFESIDKEEFSADFHFENAENYFKVGDYKNSKVEYQLAKENDALRFRAPDRINGFIKELALKYNIPIANIDSLFSENSTGKIVGYNLMVDHLHPTVEGHQLIGDLFFKVMIENTYLPETLMKNISVEKQRNLAENAMSYTRFDSTYSNITLNYLLNSYPFIKNNEQTKKKYILENYSDSLAEMVVKGKISWEKGHYLVAEKYFNQKKYKMFINEIMALIDDRPFVKSNYIFGVDKLKSVKKLDLALQILLKMNKNFPDNDYSSKWLGTIAIGRKFYKRAIHYYEKIIEHNQTDAQIFYNLSGAYFYTKQFNKAEEALKKCISISPNYPGAKQAIDRLLK